MLAWNGSFLTSLPVPSARQYQGGVLLQCVRHRVAEPHTAAPLLTVEPPWVAMEIDSHTPLPQSLYGGGWHGFQ